MSTSLAPMMYLFELTDVKNQSEMIDFFVIKLIGRNIIMSQEIVYGKKACRHKGFGISGHT